VRYQETWVRGESANIPAQRPCADRYAVVRGVADRFTRPFSVFDLGANLGYFSFRLAEDFDCTCIMADNREELRELCAMNNQPRAMWLNTRLSPDGLEALGESEYFDIVLAMSVLHHFGPRWKSALDGLIKMGMHVIVELPAKDDKGTLNAEYAEEMHRYMKAINAELLAWFPSHKSGKPRPCFLIRGRSAVINRQTIDAEARGAPDVQGVTVYPTYIGIDVRIAHGGVSPCAENRPFILGMNLWNFLLLKGTWPPKQRVISAAKAALDEVVGDDLEPWNMIIQGDEIKFIDQNTKDWKKSNRIDAKGSCLSKIIQALGRDDIEHH